MPKDRRKDKRKITRIKDLLTMRNFLIIVAILAVIICFKWNYDLQKLSR